MPRILKVSTVGMLLLLLAITGDLARILARQSTQNSSAPASKAGAFLKAAPRGNAFEATEPNLKIAFLGDAGVGESQQAVLRLVKSEAAQAVLHQGDFDYHNDPAAFWTSVDNVLGANFPYFVSVGNHDVAQWPTTSRSSYAQYLFDRIFRLGITPDDLQLNHEVYALSFKGLKVVFAGEQKGQGDDVYAPYIRGQFETDRHLWRVCSWHRNMSAMQVGDKTDDMGWGVYEACREAGAIIATAHEHSYERTKTLSSFPTQTVDPDFPDPNRVVAAPGHTFAFVSGLSGESIRVQRRCWPTEAPYGCNGEWAKIYSSNQQAEYGALFITFNVDGDLNLARGYFKTIGGHIVDEFEITKGGNSSKVAQASGAKP